MRRYLIPIILGIIILANLFIVPLIEPKLIFNPSPGIQETPSDYNIDYETVHLRLDNGSRVSTWYMDHPDSDQLLVYYHGNSYNLSHFNFLYELLQDLPIDILAIDYPGYGASSGSPSEDGFYNSALLAYSYAEDTLGYKAKDHFILGYSMGGPVATHVASQVDSAGLILINPLSALRDILKFRFSIFHVLLWPRSQFNTKEMIGNVQVPILLLHSKDDDVTPYKYSQTLYKAAPNGTIFLSSNGYNHREIDHLLADHWDALMDFIGPKE